MRSDPNPEVTRLVLGASIAQAIAVAVQLGAFDRLTEGPRPAAAVAGSIGAHPDALYRLLRLLSGVGLVEERDDRVFALTARGRALCRGEPGTLRGMALMVGAPWHRRAWSDLADCVGTGRSSFERLYGGFAYYRDDPEAGRAFREAMADSSAALVLPLLLDRDLTGFDTIVDVGGGHGALLAGLLSGHPKGRGVLFDLPHVVAHAQATLERAGVADRCEVVGGDFFTAVPSGGDVYLLANIVHDWDDERAVRILRNCAKAMNDGGRVLLCEAVLPGTRNRFSPAIVIDLEMLVMCEGGRQRTVDELGGLLEQAGLRLAGVRPGEMYSLVEAVAA